jgi:hypothetical protein
VRARQLKKRRDISHFRNSEEKQIGRHFRVQSPLSLVEEAVLVRHGNERGGGCRKRYDFHS